MFQSICKGAWINDVELSRHRRGLVGGIRCRINNDEG